MICLLTMSYNPWICLHCTGAPVYAATLLSVPCWQPTLLLSLVAEALVWHSTCFCAYAHEPASLLLEENMDVAQAVSVQRVV